MKVIVEISGYDDEVYNVKIEDSAAGQMYDRVVPDIINTTIVAIKALSCCSEDHIAECLEAAAKSLMGSGEDKGGTDANQD